MNLRLQSIFIIFFVIVIGLKARESPYGPTGGRIITGQEIREAGITRLGDLIQIIEEWDSASLDGYNWIVSPSGLDHFQHQRWQAAVDGRVIDINLMGINSLARLPVNLNQIDYIEIISEPYLGEGFWAEGGLLNIVTRKADSCSRISMSLSAGNETGDPGPYRYTDLASPNVDRIGWTGGADYVFGRENIGGRLAVREEVNYPTDQNLYFRNGRIAGNYYPRQDLIALGGRLYLGRGNDATRIMVGHSRLDDFFFLPEFGREVPTRLNLYYLDIHHVRKFREGLSLGLFLAYNDNGTLKASNTLDLDFKWRTRRWRGGLEIQGSGEKLKGKAGLVFTKDNRGDRGDGNGGELIIADLYTDWKYRFSEAFSQGFSFGLSMGDSDNGLKFIGRTSWQNRTGYFMRLVGSYVTPLWAEENRLWYWSRNGFDFLNMDDSPFLHNDKRRRNTIDLTAGGPLANNLEFEIAGFYRNFRGEFYQNRVYYFIADDSSFGADISFLTIDKGSFGGVRMRLDWRLNSKLGLGLSGNRQEVLGGDSFYRATWRNIPETELKGRLCWRTNDNFVLNLSATYLGDRYWREYLRVEEATGDRFHAGLNDFWNIDLTAQIYFWSKKIRTVLAFKNILNSDIQYHPIGAEFDLSYFALLEFTTAL